MCIYYVVYHMGRDVRNHVFGVSNKVRFKPTCSATETSYNIEISLEACLDMVLSNKQITKALIKTGLCLLLFAIPPKTGFLASRPI